jgi:hypothetical protein
LIAVPAAIALSRMARWFRAKPSRALAALGLAVFLPIAFTLFGVAYGLGQQVTTESGMSQADFYGKGDEVAWGYVDRKFGDLAILPAEFVFHRRYGKVAFRDVTEPLYGRNYRTMDWEKRDIDLLKGSHVSQVTGFTSADDGMHLVGTRGTVVFSAEWPFATSVTVKARASTDVHLSVGRGGVFGTKWYGQVPTGPQGSSTDLTIPPGGFDSGIVEIVIERVEREGDVVVQSLHFDDTGKYDPPLGR